MIKWIKDDGRYVNGHKGLKGDVVIFKTCWDGFKSKSSDKPPIKLLCKLPGIKPKLGNFTEEEARAKAEKVYSYWLSKIGLVEIDNEQYRED